MKKRNEQRVKLISTFRNNMENIQQWINEVCYFHKDLQDDCSLLSKEIEQNISSLLHIVNQETRLEFISDALMKFSQEDQIYSQIKSKLHKAWEQIKISQNFPSNIIDEIFKDVNIIPPDNITITDQDINTTKEKVTQTCSIFQSDINSITEVFYDQFYTIANDLHNIQNKNKSNRAYSKKRTPIFNHVLKHFYPNTSVFNLYISISKQQNFLSQFKTELDRISQEEAQENSPHPPKETTDIPNETFSNQIHDNPFRPSLPTFFQDDFNINIFPQNELDDNAFRNPTHSSLLNMGKRSIETPSLRPSLMTNNNAANENFRQIINALQKEKDNLTKENENLKKENSDLKKENSDLKNEVQNCEETIEFNDSLINEISEGNDEMQDEINKLKKENEQLRKLLNENNIQINLT